MENLKQEEAALTKKITAIKNLRIGNLYDQLALITQELAFRRQRIANLYRQKAELYG